MSKQEAKNLRNQAIARLVRGDRSVFVQEMRARQALAQANRVLRGSK